MVPEYAIARVRGLRGRRLGDRGIEELVRAPDRAAFLARAGYGELRGQLARDLARVDALFDGDEVIRAAAGFADALALKTLLRGLARGTPTARLVALVTPTLELDAAAVKELAAQRDAAGVAALLATWGSRLAAPLRDALAAEPHDLTAIELALDRAAFARARAAARGILAGVVADLIDLANAVTLARLGPRAADVLLPGGTLPARRLPALLPGDDPFQRDRLVEERLVRALSRAARLEPLSMAVPLLYLAERRAEIRRIRVVLEAAALELPAADVAELVFPS
jgi:vacuolar-type H+-ATPase subunit C/Vma6